MTTRNRKQLASALIKIQCGKVKLHLALEQVTKIEAAEREIYDNGGEEYQDSEEGQTHHADLNSLVDIIECITADIESIEGAENLFNEISIEP